MDTDIMAAEGQTGQEELNGDAPESEQTPQQSEELHYLEERELPDRVLYLEKRVREHEDEIVCLKGAFAETMRRLQQMEATTARNSILPSKPFPKSPRQAPSGQERPRSMVSDSFSQRTSAMSRATPRGASASSSRKKWGSMSNDIDESNGHKPARRSTQITQAQRSSSHGSLPIKAALTKGIKEPTWNSENKYLRMHLAGRPVPVYAPSKLEDYDINAPQDPPNKKLSLEWVYGYRGRDTRSNMYTLLTGELCYFTASVVVLHNIAEQTQRHYLEHTDDIKCMAVHSSGMKVATGQVAGHDKKDGKPHVRIWDVIKLNTLMVIGADTSDFQRGICCVGFSKADSGKYLLAVDEGNDHNLSVWDVDGKKPRKVAECKSSGDLVTQCEFHPIKKNYIILCGKNNISFWNLEDKRLNKRMGIFEKFDKPAHYVMICFAIANNGDVISGDNNGTIYVWGNGTNKITSAVTGAHEGGVFSLCVLPDGTFLSGGKDRKVYHWDANYEKISETELPEEYGSVRLICQGPGKMMYVGTIRNCILQGNMEMKFTQVVVEGHKGELWGLDTDPDQLQFLTCGYDKYIYLWDSLSHRPVWSREISYSAHCCCFHPNKSLGIAALGLQSPKVLLIDLNTHETVCVYTDGNEQVECVQFSPSGDKLACGNRDNSIYVYEVSDDGRKLHKIGKCTGHSSFVTHLDWDKDGEIIRSNSGDYEILYWQAKKCKQETDKDKVRDLEWATNNCTLSFNTIGIWPDGADGTDINNCSVSHDKTLVASADDFGKVNLLEYPSIQHKAKGHSYQGHSSHVTMAKFLCDDSRLITTGGNDCTILQWKVE